MHLLGLVVLFFLTLSSSFASNLNFTEEEKAWIAKSSTIILGADYKWPPFDFVDAKGQHVGLAADYLELIAKKTGLKFRVMPNKWSITLENMKAKKYHGLSCAVETDERKKYLLFTEPYLSVPMVIIKRKGDVRFKKLEDLIGKTVSINKDSYVHEWLEKKHPEIKLHLSTSNEESLQAVSMGKVDAYLGNLAVATYVMNKFLINNLEVVSSIEGFNTEVSIAIDKENYILLNIIQKALSSISDIEHQTIKRKWKENLSLDKNVAYLDFSSKEQAWIDKHKKIRYVIDNNWYPLEYFNEELSMHEGITKSYLDLVSKKTGLEFELVKTKNWSESVVKIKNKEADLYTAIAKTQSRSEIVDFSTPYITMPEVFVTKKEISLIQDIKSLYGKKIALVKDYYMAETIKKEHPFIEVVEVETITKALELVTQGKVVAYIDVLPIVSYYIQQKGFSNLKIAGMSDYSFAFSMAIRKDWSQEGLSVINKALKSITEEEKSDIYNRWFHVEYSAKIDYTLVWKVVAFFVLFLGLSLYWNRKLTNEVSMRKLAQEELLKLNVELEEAKDSAQSANMAKSNFLSNMSHEIRTPMNSILGFADLLYEKIEDKKLKSYVSTIRSSGQALLFLINDILDLSKIESGKLEIIKTASSIKNLFKEIENLFSLQIEQKGLEFKINIDKKIPPSLILDAIRVKEILINLVGNALKFTQTGGIYIDVIAGTIHTHQSKIDLFIVVKDTGIGIPKSSQEKIFNTFEQVENQDIRKYGGTGLGLAISKKLAKLMEGTLEVKSEESEGASFTLSLKNIDIASICESDEELEKSFDFSHVEFQKAIILIVDDVPANRELIKECFAGTNIQVDEAQNGQEAIFKAKERDYNLIFMDIRMPVMDGYSATRVIKEFSATPIIALTASIMQDELKKIEGERFSGYLRKPVSKEELYKIVSNYIQYAVKEKKEAQEVKEIVHETDVKTLRAFYEELKETKIETMYQKAILTNDFSIIKEFSQELFKLSKKHGVVHMIEYCENLFEQIDVFDINAIVLSLNQYPLLILHIEEKL
ncbi:MAG TPA: histidine kinase [Sulfurospirillum sp. UBA11407]|nr:MAG TPA: histidine kinase [Sulfurospirillum sp. UBA11407]